jgi:phosphatidylinositol-3-phosphatase
LVTANCRVDCPSLAAYLLMTSGTTAGICDDQDPDTTGPPAR